MIRVIDGMGMIGERVCGMLESPSSPDQVRGQALTFSHQGRRDFLRSARRAVVASWERGW